MSVVAGTAAALALTSATAAAETGRFFQPASSPVSVPAGVDRLDAFDIEGDGDADLAVSSGTSNGITIMRNNGAGRYRPTGQSPITVGAPVNDILGRDLTGDGLPDLVVVSTSTDSVYVLKNKGGRRFAVTGGSPVLVSDQPDAIAVADFNGDGARDVAVAHATNPGLVTLLKNNGRGGLKPFGSSPLTAGNKPVGIVAADLAGGPATDLAVSNQQSQNVSVFQNDGSAHFHPTSGSPFFVLGAFPAEIDSGDLDADGDTDLATADSGSGQLSVLKNNGSGVFSEPPSSPESVHLFPLSLAVGNLDGAPGADVAVANFSSSELDVLLNAGTGNLSEAPHSPFATGPNPSGVVIPDVDGDGDHDIVAANENGASLTILENR
jgi:hypothetical protein